MQNPRRSSGLFLPSVSRINLQQAQSRIFARKRQARWATAKEEEAKWKLKRWQSGHKRRSASRGAKSAECSRKFLALVPGGFAMRIRWAVFVARKRAQKVRPSPYTESARRRACKGRSCRKISAV